ncbi:MAG: sugar-binding transcriptional regulator, partial [Bacilli bacterium]|nr:sugar-binding transcriptional regulator [Bacilli bacterium]
MDSKDKHLLVEIAVMYYLEGKTQTEIAKEMFMSRPKVSRLLQRARDLDIVDIKINYESDDFNRLKTQIQHRFGVENVVIVKTLSNEDETIKEMGRAAANEIKYHLNDNITIGMSWGRSVKQAVKG